jgi:hypothetical protein
MALWIILHAATILTLREMCMKNGDLWKHSRKNLKVITQLNIKQITNY